MSAGMPRSIASPAERSTVKIPRCSTRSAAELRRPGGLVSYAATDDSVAPFWNGLVAVTFTSTGKGMPNYNDIQIYDPSLGAFTQGGGSVSQKEDGTFLALVTPRVTEQNKDLDFKVRVRSELDGCAPSDWVETPSFKLGEPLSGTTWKATVEAGEFSGNLNVNYSGTGTQTALGPYHFDPSGFQQTIAFQEGGTFTDTLEFGIESGHGGDLYAGCRFQLHTEGKWAIKFVQYSPNVLLSERKLSASPLAGSTCNSPSLGLLDINKSGFDANLEPVAMGLDIDYTGLVYATPGKVKWSSSSLLNAFGNELPLFNFTDVNGGSNVNGYVSVQAPYEKQ